MADKQLEKKDGTWAQSPKGQDDTLNELFDTINEINREKITFEHVLSLGLTRLRLSRILYYYDLYQKIIGVPGIICEFGVR
jgi:hypothetical protein